METSLSREAGFPQVWPGHCCLSGRGDLLSPGVSLQDGADRCSNEIMEDEAALDDQLTVSLCPGHVSVQACTLYHTGSAAC